VVDISGPRSLPIRLQLSRRKGFDLQALSLATNGLPAIVVGRPTRWGNPFVVGVEDKAEYCVQLYRMMLNGYICLTCKVGVDLQKAARIYVRGQAWRLKGKNLACWCRLDRPCHADALLELANR